MPGPASPPLAHQTCAGCRFWRPDPAAERTAGWGQCRRMPPSLPPIEDDKLVHVGLWPHTDGRDWCGEWRAPDAAAGPPPAGC